MKRRYVYIDLFRLIAALMVIGIHTFPFESLSRNLDFALTHVIFRVAVPFFVMTSGFFMSDKLKSGNLKSVMPFVAKNLKLYALCVLLYLPLNFYMYRSGQWEMQLQSLQSVSGWIKLFLFDSPMYHLWYFPAMILGSVLFTLLCRKNYAFAMGMSAFLYFLGLFGDSYYGLVRDNVLGWFYQIFFHFFTYTRNGIFYIPLFLGLGALAREYVLKRSNRNVFLIFCLSLCMLFEGFVLYYGDLMRHDSMYLFLPLLIFVIFSEILSRENMREISSVVKIPQLKGDLNIISLVMYIIHPYVIVMVRLLGKLFKLESIFVENSVIHFVMVSAFSFIIGYYVSLLINYLRGKHVEFGKIKGVDRGQS